jgi:hypothetical protein
MKRFILLALVVCGVGIGGYYASTGRMPWVFQSEEEQQVAALKEELGRIRQQWQQAGKAQSFGLDTGSIAEGPLAQLDQLEKSLTELTPRLKTPEARNQAGSLRRDITAFKATMR